jgi:hypothetical protein
MERKFSSSNYSPIFGTSSEGFYILEKMPLYVIRGQCCPYRIQENYTGIVSLRQFRDNEA